MTADKFKKREQIYFLQAKLKGFLRMEIELYTALFLSATISSSARYQKRR